MREAAVGHQCPECVREGARSVRQARTLFGARVHAVPVVTYALIVLNVLAYLAQLVRPQVTDRFGMLGAGLMDEEGAHYLWEPALREVLSPEGVAAGEWERLLTGAFLHMPVTQTPLGLLHIVLNMAALWNLGRVVETQLGRVRFLALYLLSALGGSVLVLLIAPGDLVIGASGGVFGLGAAYYVIARRVGAAMQPVNRFMVWLLVWLVLSAGFASWQGHLGGLLVGAAVTAAYAFVPGGERRWLVQAGACVVLLTVLVVCAWGKVVQLTGGAA